MNRSIVVVALMAAALLSSSVTHAETSPGPVQDPDGASSTPQDRPGEDTTPFRIGAIAGVGFPRPLAIEGMVKIDRYVALGVEYSLLPKTTIGAVETKFSAIAADARVFPFGNAFFVGLRGGRQTLSATATANLWALGSYADSAVAETWFINPRLGVLWTSPGGLTLGIDAGVQIPINPSLTTSSTLPDGLPVQVDSGIASIADAFGNKVTPTVDLLRIGVLF